MNILKAFDNEKETRNFFTWQTRNGMAPAFGSRPIGWYQQHQCAAHDVLKELCHALYVDASALRVKSGDVIGRQIGEGKWIRIASTQEIFNKADSKIRA